MHFTIKPTSFSCNLNCDYCFYLPKGDDFLPKSTMKEDTLEIFVKKYIQACDSHVFFTWQGGEPLLMGLDFYKKAIELQNKYKGTKIIENAIQTNGTLLNDKWCEFIKEHNILVGISIDGPKKLHDAYRKNMRNEGTFDEVLRGIDLLKKHKIKFNTLTCINKANYRHGFEVYKFLKNIGSTYMQFSEIIETTPENRDFDAVAVEYNKKQFALEPQDYAIFFKDIFRHWVKYDIGHIVVRQFETFISLVLGHGHLSCVFEDKCCNNFVLEANGDIYECDQAVYEKYKIGNIHTSDITKLEAAKINKVKTTLSSDCLECQYLSLCHGGCPKHRINLNNGVAQTYFCEGYKELFKIMVPYLNAMVSLAQSRIPYVKVKEIADKIASL